MVNIECTCGCDSFRFKEGENNLGVPVTNSICRNCNHKLVDHITVTRSKQAE